MNTSKLKNKIIKLPKSPGVYIFYGKKGSAQGGFRKAQILYIGKATNLRSRVQSYFRGGEAIRPIEAMIYEVADVGYQKTDSVLEALIMEANLIKKYLPKYNAMGKDDKSFSYFVVTKEEYPRVLIFRKTNLDFKKLQTKNYKLKTIFGPYTSKKQMETALKIIRKIFPFHSNNQKTEKGCLDFQIGRCPGPYAGAITKADYLKNIRGIRMILEGKKKSLVKKLEKEMKAYARKNEFEKAAYARNKLFSLKHIQDIALISREDNLQIKYKNQKPRTKNLRIEAYDVSNISGQHATGSMVVFQNNEPDKSQYRKFRIKTIKGSNDAGMMKEVLMRRFKNDWPMPDLILLDGGIGHLNMAIKLLGDLKLNINIAAVAKGPSRKKLLVHSQQFIDNRDIKNILDNKNLLKRIMDEAHRFAISYHKKLRKKDLLE